MKYVKPNTFMTQEKTKIQFSSTPPTEPGAYYYRREKKGGGYYAATLEDLQESFQSQIVQIPTYIPVERLKGLWSPKLIPITELDEARKRIGELELKIENLEGHLMQYAIRDKKI